VEGARDAAHLRRLNLERVLAAAMAREGAFTRAELIAATGLSAPTVGSLATSLIRAGLLTDLGSGPSRGGRRPSHMEFNRRHGFIAAIDLGPTRTRLAVADLRGELLLRREVSTPEDKEPRALLNTLARETREMLRAADVPFNRLLAVGAGAPGAVDPATGTIVALAPNLPGWDRVPVAAILRTALKAPVVVENDVNLAVLGEHWKGAARDHDNCVFLSFGTGIGAGILVNGRLHHGHHALAGEIGLMCMGPQFVNDDFAGRGCLETLAGLGALRSRWRGPDNAADWLPELFRAAANGDRDAHTIVEEVGTLVGMAAANVSCVMDPSLVVLGGALGMQGEPLLRRVRQIVGRIMPAPPAVVGSDLDKDAPLWGSLLVAMGEARERVRRELGGRARHESVRKGAAAS
jgi:predicted NBD/HSP70 family sugar kinase